jgi:predicted small lipoprotein YifL
VSRRRVLSLTAAALIGALSGCNDSGPPELPEFRVLIANGTERTVSVTVWLYRDDSLFDSYNYTLGPGKADESEAVDTEPERVEIDVRGRHTTTHGYSVPANCRNPNIKIHVESDTSKLNNGCLRG